MDVTVDVLVAVSVTVDVTGTTEVTVSVEIDAVMFVAVVVEIVVRENEDDARTAPLTTSAATTIATASGLKLRAGAALT